MPKHKRSKRKKKTQILNVKQVTETVKRNGGKILFMIIGFALIAFFAVNINSFLFASVYFNVTDIEVIDSEQDKVDYPLARIKDNPNIFKINLSRIAEDIERHYHDIQKATVKRVLPNKLVIEILRRHPVAQLAISINRDNDHKNYIFTVNKEAYVLANIGTRPLKKLPVIYGSGLNIKEIQIGRSYLNTNTSYALSFLEELDLSGFRKHYPVTKIDVSQPRSMSFFINNTLEVKIGNRNWKEKIENLTSILQNMDIDYSEDYYIDLRFKDFVFGKK